MYKDKTREISFIKKHCKYQLKPIEVKKVRSLGHFMLSLKKNPDLPCVISDKCLTKKGKNLFQLVSELTKFTIITS